MEQGNQSELERQDDQPMSPEDSTPPLLYPKRAIVVFSVIFSVLFGSILLAINLRENKVKTVMVILPVIIGFVCNYLLMMLMAVTHSTGIPIIVINGLLGILLTDIFWKRYIGTDTEYRKRPITVPLLIGIGISLVMIIMMRGVAGM